MNNPSSRAVVTGAAGFIGRALVAELRGRGWDVCALDLRGSADGSVRAADVAQAGALDGHARKGDIIFHLASPADVSGSVADPLGDFRVTLGGTLHVLETARRSGSIVIFPSTASIFDPTNIQPVSENARVRPTSPYSAAKAAAEAYCSAYYRSYGVDARIVRLFSVYGPGMRRFAIHDIVRKIQANPEEISLLGDGAQIRDYLYIDDVIRGLIHIAVEGAPGEDYNVGSGKPVTIMDLAHRIAGLMGRPHLRITTTGQSFPGDVAKWYGDVSKAKRVGFEASVPLDAGLRRTIAWLTGVASP